MPAHRLKPGDRTVQLTVRLEGSTVDLLTEIADRKEMSVVELVRAVVRDFAWGDEVRKPTPIDRGRRDRRRRRAPRFDELPDRVDNPVGFLAGLRVPAKAVHDYVPQADGPPICAACGATPAEQLPCR